jgi:hypothetical protein
MFPARKETGTNLYPAHINRSSNARLVPLTLVPTDSKLTQVATLNKGAGNFGEKGGAPPFSPKFPGFSSKVAMDSKSINWRIDHEQAAKD